MGDCQKSEVPEANSIWNSHGNNHPAPPANHTPPRACSQICESLSQGTCNSRGAGLLGGCGSMPCTALLRVILLNQPKTRMHEKPSCICVSVYVRMESGYHEKEGSRRRTHGCWLRLRSNQCFSRMHLSLYQGHVAEAS